MKLSQNVALLKTAKNGAHQETSLIHHQLQRVAAFVGRVRTYQPREDDGDTFPVEVEVVQSSAPELLTSAAKAMGRLFDAQAAVDYGNTQAKANVVVDGKTIVADAPVPYLLFLEKQLKDWITVIKKLPVLDPSKEWFWSQEQGLFFTEGVKTVKTKRITKHQVVVPPTDKHPAQVKSWEEDVPAGDWNTLFKSGAMHKTRIKVLLERAEALAEAVKVAREEANSQEVTSKRGTGKVVFDYLLAE